MEHQAGPEPRGTPGEEPRPQVGPFREQRRDEFGRLGEEFRDVRLERVIPLAAWLGDRPWNLLWVRWLVFYAFFPLALGRLIGEEGIPIRNAVWAFGLYFAGVWLTVLSMTMRPEKLNPALIVEIAAFTAVVGIVLVVLVQQLPVISAFYGATRSDVKAESWIGFVLGVGVLEEIVKALPVYLLVFYQRLPFRPLTYSFLGAVSGLAFGVAEAVPYSFRYTQGLLYGQLNVGTYLLVEFTRLITLPLLHAIFAGITGYFIGLAALNRRASRALMLIGIGLAALLHGTYDCFSDSWLGVGVAVLALMIFISYIRTGDLIAREIARSEADA